MTELCMARQEQVKSKWNSTVFMACCFIRRRLGQINQKWYIGDHQPKDTIRLGREREGAFSAACHRSTVEPCILRTGFWFAHSIFPPSSALVQHINMCDIQHTRWWLQLQLLAISNYTSIHHKHHRQSSRLVVIISNSPPTHCIY